MATSVVQDTKATNSLAQTFSNTYTSQPTEGNYLAAWVFHDETSADIASLTSSGWTRVGTVPADLSGVNYRISLYMKIAGASETQTVSWDLGEVNRRAHGYAVEFSGVPLEAVPATDGAASETGVNASGTSNQIDNPISAGGGQLGMAMVGLNGVSATPPTWASEVTGHENWSNNFRASAVGFFDPSVTVQPTATWGSGRANMQVVFILGEAQIPVTLKRHSSFQLVQAP